MNSSLLIILFLNFFGELFIWFFVHLNFQYVTEKMGGAEGTKLDLDFMDMEKVFSIKFCTL